MKNYKQSNLKFRLPFEIFWLYPSSFQQLELISLFEELDRKSNAATVLLQVQEKWQASRSSISKSRTNFLNLKGKMERLSIEPQAKLRTSKNMKSYSKDLFIWVRRTGLARLDEMKFGVFIWKNLVPAHRDVLRYVIMLNRSRAGRFSILVSE